MRSLNLLFLVWDQGLEVTFSCLYGHVHFLCKSVMVDILYTVDTGFENRYHNTLMKKISMHKDRNLLVPLGKLLTLTERNVA